MVGQRGREAVRSTDAPHAPAHSSNGSRALRAGAARRPRGRENDRGSRGPLLVLVGVALLYAVSQMLVFSLGEYYVNRDEAIYLTQVVPGEVAHDMAMHRTRGMSILVAPVAPWAQSMPALRGWLVLLGAVGIVVAFRPWIRAIGWAAPVSAFVFAAYWVNFLFGAQLYPNFFAALFAIATAGHLVAYLRDGRRGDLVAVAALIGMTAFVRPLDSVLVALALWVGTVLLARGRAVAVTVALGLGGLAGFAPWLAEGWIRFELLPWELLFQAEETGASGQEGNNLAVYLNNTDGPFRCVGDCPEEVLADGITMAWRERIALAGFLGASLLGLAGSPRRTATRACYVAGMALAALLAYYLTCDCAINLRYLEPAFGFLAILIGVGAARAWGIVGVLGAPAATVLRVVGVVLIAGWAVYQALLASVHVEEGFGSRERAFLLAGALDARAGGEPCAVAAAVSDRQIQFYSDCIAVSLNRSDTGMVQNRIGGTTSVFDLGLLSEAGYRIYAVGRPRHVPESSPVWDWEVIDISSERLGEYLLFEAPPGVEIETEYRDGYSPEDAGPP